MTQLSLNYNSESKSEFFKVLAVVQEKSDKYSALESISSPQHVYSFIKDKIGDLANEVCGVIHLDIKNKPIGWGIVSQGTFDQTLVSPKSIFSTSLLCGASSIILFHNHPAGSNKPSLEDIELTKVIKDGAKVLDMKVLDHIIVGDDYFSFKENGMM